VEGVKMPFSKEMIKEINNYCKKDLPKCDFYNKLFLFIKDTIIRDKIILEFKNTRFFYKIFEGLHVTDKRLLIETKMQMIMYASIHEAIVSYVVLVLYKDDPVVRRMLKIKKLHKYSIPERKKDKINELLIHDKKKLILCYYSEDTIDETKIRYDAKVDALYKLKLISSKMKEDLIKIYEYRNTVHIEADLKKNLDYTIEMSELAYKRVIGLNIELDKSIYKR